MGGGGKSQPRVASGNFPHLWQLSVKGRGKTWLERGTALSTLNLKKKSGMATKERGWGGQGEEDQIFRLSSSQEVVRK